MLLEARTVGWAASGRNGGFCEASLTHGEDNGRGRWPKEIDRLTELGLDCDFERTGAIDLTIEEHQVECLRGETTDEHTDFLDAAAVQAEVS